MRPLHKVLQGDPALCLSVARKTLPGAELRAHVPQTRAEAATGVWAVGRPSDVRQGSRSWDGCAAAAMSAAQGGGSRELRERAES